MTHPCSDHKVSRLHSSHIKPYSEMYCHDCDREFTGMYQSGELVEYGGTVEAVFKKSQKHANGR